MAILLDLSDFLNIEALFAVTESKLLPSLL